MEGGSTAERRVTLDDVACEAGVHRSTVSQVLNDHPNCWASASTRERIRKTVRELGYRPNLAARALRSGCSRVIGFVSPGFQAGTHSRPGGLSQAAADANYTVALSSHPNDSESEDLVIRRFMDRGVDGLAVYPVDTGEHRELHRLVKSSFPVVTFEGVNLLDFDCDDVSVDLEAVGRLQAQHLLELGCRRICLVGTDPQARIGAIGLDAANRELVRLGAAPPLEVRLLIPRETEIPDAEAQVPPLRRFLERYRNEIDGVIGNDYGASLAVRVFNELNVRVPEEVAVVGSGNTPLADYGSMPLTSVSTADDVSGLLAFEFLLNRIRHPERREFQRLKSPVELVKRRSSERKGPGNP